MRERIRSWLRLGEADHLALGRWGERVAARAVKREGLKLLGRRVRVGKHDEIDLLCRWGNVLVVVEVKTRSNENWAAPIEAVNYQKRYRLSRAAVRYARNLNPRPDAIRFDVVEVIGRPGQKPDIRYHVSAFGLDHRFRW